MAVIEIAAGQLRWQQANDDDDPPSVVTLEPVENESWSPALKIAGIPMHVSAARVKMEGDMQVGWDAEAEYHLNDLTNLAEPDKPFYAVGLEGFEGEWVVWCEPYCN